MDKLLSWGEDHGVFRQADGEPVEVDLSPYTGQSGLMLRWRYSDPDPQAFDWYAQVDDAGVVCDRDTCDAPPITGGVVDGGFESGSPWTAASTRFATPICTSTSCGVAAARTGDGWVFLGGSQDSPEQASVEQTVPLPVGLATLSFYLWVPQASGNGTDAFVVLLDGQQVFTAGEGEPRYRAGYRRVDVDLSQQADGGGHLLRFEASTSGAGGHSNFMLDDVSLEICTAVVADPDISIGNITLEEGNSGTVDAVFTVSLSASSQNARTSPPTPAPTTWRGAAR